jgi:hypothetical protein
MAASDLQRLWRPTALAALLMLSGCKDLMPSYMGGDVRVEAHPASQSGLQAQVRYANGAPASRRAASS